MASSSKPPTPGFDLEDLSKHIFAVKHDCSFSRQGALIRDNDAFNQELWEVALTKINGSAHVNPIEIGRAESARIQDASPSRPAIYLWTSCSSLRAPWTRAAADCARLSDSWYIET